MSEIIKGTFPRLELELEPYLVRPEISADIQQTLARLLAWDEVNQTWRQVECDGHGYLKTVPGGNSGRYSTFVQTDVDTTAVFVLDEHETRLSWLIKNMGSTTIYIGFDSGVLTTTGFPIGPGEAFGDDSYNGDVYAIGDAAGGRVFRLEMEQVPT